MHWSYVLTTLLVIGFMVSLILYIYFRLFPSKTSRTPTPNALKEGKKEEQSSISDDMIPSDDPSLPLTNPGNDVITQRRALPRMIEKDFSKTPIPRITPPESTRAKTGDSHQTFIHAMMQNFEKENDDPKFGVSFSIGR